MEYSHWLGLDDNDSELFWIARQALDTPIPVPWIECQSEDGEVFFFNTRTKESLWDHPYDAYYKAAIKRFKQSECTKSDLLLLVSQPWLLSGPDNRISHKSCDDVGQLLASISNPDKVDHPLDSLVFSHSMSPNRGRRRPSGMGQMSPGSHRVSEATEIEIQQLRHQADNATTRNVTLSQELQQMKTDLVKARDYIELLLLENKGLRNRMTEASSKVTHVKHEGSSLRDQLILESKKREIAERKVLVLEDRVRALEIASPQSSPRSTPLFSRLCGSSVPDGVNTRPVVGRARSGLTSTSVTPKQSQAHPTMQSPDPYKELMALLAVPSIPPSSKSVQK